MFISKVSTLLRDAIEFQKSLTVTFLPLLTFDFL